jgi:hypothetical protein
MTVWRLIRASTTAPLLALGLYGCSGTTSPDSGDPFAGVWTGAVKMRYPADSLTIWIPDAPEVFSGGILVPPPPCCHDLSGSLYRDGTHLTGGLDSFGLDFELQAGRLVGVVSDDGVHSDSVRLTRYRPARTDVTGTWVTASFSSPYPNHTYLDTLRIKADGRIWSSSRIFSDGAEVFGSLLWGYYQRQGAWLRIRNIVFFNFPAALPLRDSFMVAGDTLLRTRNLSGDIIHDRLTRRQP